MGINDRGYYRDEGRGRGGMLSGRMSPISGNNWIIIINVAFALIAGFGGPGSGMVSGLWDAGSFSTAKAFLYAANGKTMLGLEVWRFVTFQFLHGGFWHLALNMFGLWVFGSLVEQQLGTKRYLAFYLVCGIFGGLSYLFLNLLGTTFHLNLPGVLFNNPHTPLVGASAGVFGVIMACAYIAPNEIVQLMFPPIALRMKTMAYAYVGLAALNLFMSGHNAGGDAAHLGGAAAGFFFIRNSHLLMDFFDVLSDSRKPKKTRVPRGAPVPRADVKSDREVDRILAKINERGIESLSDREKKTLARASRT